MAAEHTPAGVTPDGAPVTRDGHTPPEKRNAVGGSPRSASRGKGRSRRPDIKWSMVTTEAGLLELVDEVGSGEIYGIDTEFHRERTYWPHLALLQISWPAGIALVDPLAVNVGALAAVLNGPGLAVLHAADQDLEVLERGCGATPSELFDTQLCAGFLDMSSPSLGSLVERMLGHRLEKGDQLTDWTRRPLTRDQLTYAASDVAYLMELHEVVSAQLEARNRAEWAAEECRHLLERSHAPVDPDEAWWKLKQARQLRGVARGVAQSVASWRELRARRLDIPARFVLSDLAFASICQRPPRSRSELSAVRSLDNRHLGNGAEEELLDAIARGTKLDPLEIRLPPRMTEDAAPRPSVALATAWAGQRAHELGIDPAILATRSDVANYLRDPPSGRLVGTWRQQLVGEPLTMLARGEAALAIGSDGALVIERRSGVAI